MMTVKKFEKYINEYKMLEGKKGVVAAVSGGADSVCLLLLLKGYVADKNISLRAIHVEHGIRGVDSLEDAKYVQELCDLHGIELEIYHVKVLEEVKKTGESVEEAARRLRYEVLKRNLGEDEVLAVAHHKMDQAETVILNLLRGSHIKGLGGMSPVNNNIIRPLLGVSREEIEQFLRERGINWREDCTNEDTDLARNLVRKEIIPLMTKINSEAVEHLCRVADEMEEVDDYLNRETDILYEKAVVKTREKTLILENMLKDLHQEMKTRILYRAFIEFSGRAKDIGKTNIKSIEDLFEKQVSRRISLPYGVTAVRTYDGVELRFEKDESRRDKDFLTEQDIEMEILDASQVGESYKDKNNYTKYFDYDIISCSANLRFPMDGDYLEIDSNGHRKSLMDYLSDIKVPLEDRRNTLVLADDNHIMWVVGKRISEHYKISQKTKKILKATVVKKMGRDYGRES